MISKFSENDKEKIIVTLAMIQNVLDENTKRTSDHHKALFGNGSPENSIVWSIKELSQSIKDLSEEIKLAHEEGRRELEELKKEHKETRVIITELRAELEKYKSNDENLSWKQWFKKISMKWLPILLIILLAIIAFRQSLSTLVVGLVKLFT